MADDRILELLAAVHHGDQAGRLMSNGLLVDHLGWTAAEVAEGLGTARERLLIWGLPGWGNPRPQFNELELTVQGRRLLETRPTSNGRQTGDRRLPRKPAPPRTLMRSTRSAGNRKS
jgi:hypothetical protein